MRCLRRGRGDRQPEETDYRDEEFAVAQVEYEGETYVFCSEEHRDTFEATPEKYA
ncbi:YHS domain-containing protein [Halorussus caseinilyticus]|uniref:YHS domain-containing protein n=1 Tax=Halorussus caseinilyticus TaxID=3034025 RepID=A0ABD5WM40_9EURY